MRYGLCDYEWNGIKPMLPNTSMEPASRALRAYESAP